MWGGMRSAYVAVALGLLGASAAKADNTYSFTLTPVTTAIGSSIAATGTFSLNGIGVLTAGSATLTLGTSTYTLNSFTSASRVISFGTTPSIVQIGFNSTVSSAALNFSGNVSGTANSFSGTLSTNAVSSSGSSSAGSGFFTAALSSAPGGGGGSGGAPAPEVSGILGMALAGSTLAFLRRRRGNRVSHPAA